MWFYIALATAIISAISVVISKRVLKDVSPAVLTWAVIVLATPIVAVFAIQEGLPQLNNIFFLGVIGSVFFYTISKVLQFRAMRIANLSDIYPLVSLGPVFTLVIAFSPPLHEIPSNLAILGVPITLLGTYILNVSNIKKDILRPIKLLFTNKASYLMLISIIIDSVVIIFDKVAINNTVPQNTTFVLLVEDFLVIAGLLPILYFKNKGFTKQIWDNKNYFLILGILNAASTILAFLAVGGGNVGLVSTILKSQIIFVLLFSFIFFKDQPKLETIIGSVIMIVGVILIKVGM